MTYPANNPIARPIVYPLNYQIKPLNCVMDLDTESGTSAVCRDLSGFGNNGVVTGASPTKIFDTNAYYFDGADDVITVTGDMIGTGDVTVSLWINPETWGEGGYGRIISNGKYTIALDTGLVWVSSDDVAPLNAPANSLALGVWHHVAITRKADGKASFYINGVLVGTADQASGVPTAGNDTLIGDRAASDRCYKGLLGVVRIYSRILHATEIMQSYNADCMKYGLLTK